MSTAGRVRIIAGRWRRRLLPVPDSPGLRPTPDRVRETLFNWLADDLPGAACLDLFAGTGVLGFEAASRGAARVVLVERSRAVATHLEAQVRAFGAAAEIRVVCQDAESWLRAGTEAFDVVFIDPPFGAFDVPELLTMVADSGRLKPHARVFVESPAADPRPPVPAHWQLLREQRAGRVRYHLAAPPPRSSFAP